METDLSIFTDNIKNNKRPPPLTKTEIKFIFRQLLEAVDWMHSKLVMHRDLKPQNVLISKDCSQVKVTDLGYAKRIEAFGTREMDPFLGELEDNW